MIDKNNIINNFNKASLEYNNYANVQLIMAKKLINMIRESNIKTVLEIGCGTGNLTNIILENYKDINLTVIDISEKMLDEAKKNIIKKGISLNNIRFICDDGEFYKFKKGFDLIISNATFQWFNSFEKSIRKYINLLNAKGELLISTFGEDTFIELELSSIRACEELNIENRFKLRRSFVKKDEINKILLSTNKEYRLLEDRNKEYHENAKCFLNSVKMIGANICSKKRVLTPPKVIKKVLEVYDREFIEKGFVYTTYHCVYLGVYS